LGLLLAMSALGPGLGLLEDFYVSLLSFLWVCFGMEQDGGTEGSRESGASAVLLCHLIIMLCMI
jgi:hypothetical protein